MYVCVCGSNLSCVTIGIGALSPAPPQLSLGPVSKAGVDVAPFQSVARTI